MTSRRSRLKAVANLPVRRKVSELPGNSNEFTTSNNLTSGKIPSRSPKPDEGFSSTVSQNFEPAVEILNSQNESNGSKRNIKNCTEFSTNDKQVEEPLIITSDFSNVNAIENFSEANKDCTLTVENDNINNSLSVTYSKQLKPNLPTVLSVLNPKAQDRNLENEIFEKHNSWVNDNHINRNENDNNSKSCNNNNNNNTIIEGLKCYTVLMSRKKSVTVDTNSNSHTQENNFHLNWNYETQGAKEVLPCTELINPSEQYTSLSAIVSNRFPNDSESVVTNELTQQNNKVMGEINADKNDYESNMSQNIIVRSSAKNVPVTINQRINAINGGDYQKNLVISVKNKVVANSNSLVYQTVASDSDFLNANAKQSISTLRKKKPKCHDFTKKLSDARREFQKKYEKTKPDRSTLRMIDLIFYNPSTNPMESKVKLDKKRISDELILNSSEEEGVDEPEPMDSASSRVTESGEVDNISKMPVPQVKIGVNGEIILDEKSLIIETTDAKKGREDLLNSVPVFEDRESKVSYYKSKSKKTRDWTDTETKRFYKALNTIGPDFSLMRKYFPERSRLDLKNKFKREERLNRNLIDKALNNPSEFDMTQLEQDLADEKRAAEEEAEMKLSQRVKIKQKSKRRRSKSSVLFREMTAAEGEHEDTQLKTVVVNSRRLSHLERDKKKKEVNFIFQKVLLKNSEKQICELPGISSTSSCLFQSTDQAVT